MLLLALLRDPKAYFLLSLGSFDHLRSFGPPFRTLGVVLALFGDLWGPFGVPLGGFGLWGSFGLPLGCLGGHFGRLWVLLGCIWILLEVNNVKKVAAVFLS